MFDHPYIFTFYSYKGGVGRSLALLNMAYTLAGRGRHVLVVEMDLEAPGISGFLQRQKELASSDDAHPKDILSLLGLAFAEVRASWDPDTLAMKPGWDAQAAAQNLPPVSAFVRSVADDKLAPLRPRVGQLGRLDVIVADVERDYWRRLAELAIQGTPQPQLIEVSKLLHFYFKTQRFPHRPFGLEPFEPPVQTPYDYVLVDSRTGMTEVSGLCVGPLADRLVVFTSLNDQNVHGTLAFMKEAGIEPKPRPADQERWDEADPGAADETAKPSLGPKPTLLVASPVPSGEIDYKRHRLNELEELLGLSPTKLSYHPQMGLIESIFVRDYPEEYLALEYNEFGDRMMAQVHDHPEQLADRNQTLWDAGRRADAVVCVLRLAPHRPELGNALLAQLGDSLESATDNEFLVERQLHAFMSQLAGEAKHEALSNWGVTLTEQAKTKTGEPADRLFEAAGWKHAEALRLKPDDHEALNNWGATLAEQAKTKTGEAADRLFEAACQKCAESLRLKPDFHEALSNWGFTLSAQAKMKTGEAADRLFEAAGQRYAEALRLKTDSHEALYNLSCLHALKRNSQEAISWLKLSLSLGGKLTRKEIAGDTDFDRIRTDPSFRAFVESLPEQ